MLALRCKTITKDHKSYLLGFVMFTGVFALLRCLAEKSNYDENLTFMAFMEFEYMGVYMALFPIILSGNKIPHKDVMLFLGTAGIVLISILCYSQKKMMELGILGVFMTCWISKTNLVLRESSKKSIFWYLLTYLPIVLYFISPYLHARDGKKLLPAFVLV